jgi:hypothetical protein
MEQSNFSDANICSASQDTPRLYGTEGSLQRVRKPSWSPSRETKATHQQICLRKLLNYM